MDYAKVIDRFGLKAYCRRCGVRGRFFPRVGNHRYRLREVRCARVLSDGETVCGGQIRARPRDTITAIWPTGAIPFETPQRDLWPQNSSR